METLKPLRDFGLRLDKLADARADFIAPEMLPPDCGPSGANTDDDNDYWGPIDDERVMADVELARTEVREPFLSFFLVVC